MKEKAQQNSRPLPRALLPAGIQMDDCQGQYSIGLSLLKKSGGKRGWQEGQGLGSHAQGPTEPLQPTIREGNAGIGFEPQKKIKNEKQREKTQKANHMERARPHGESKTTCTSKDVKEEQEDAHRVIGRMLSTAFNDETDIPKPRVVKRKKGQIQASTRITRTNPLLD